jgi:molecular chaperone GrpE
MMSEKDPFNDASPLDGASTPPGDDAEKSGVSNESEASEASETASEMLEHIEALKAKEAEIAQLKDQNMRLQAQMHNLDRQNDKRVADAAKYAGTKMVEALLPVLDGFSQAMALGEPEADNLSAKAMYDGLKMSADVLNKVMKKQSVEVIDPSVGEAFNPDFHEAITMQKDEAQDSGAVLAVAQLGYKLHERVLRPARVVVNE